MIKIVQEKVAREIGLTDKLDKGCHDAERACFLSTMDDVLFYTPTMFEEIIPVDKTLIMVMDKAAKDSIKHPKQAVAPATAQEESETRRIEREFYALTGGEPVEGERHNRIKEWAKAAVYMADSEEQLKGMLTPYGLPDDEVAGIAKWAWENADMFTYPDPPVILSMAQAKANGLPLTVEEVIARNYRRLPLPELPRTFSIFTDLHDDDEKKTLAFLSTLPVAGTVMNNIESQWWCSADGKKVARPDFMVFLYGPSGCCKSMAGVPLKYLTEDIEKHDNKSIARHARKKKSERKYNHPFVQRLGDNCTRAALLENFAQNGGLASLMYTPEVKGLTDSFRAGKHADLSTDLRKCYDRDIIDSNRQGKDYLTAHGIGALNLLATGTTDDTWDFLDPQLEGGAARRVITYPFPEPKGFTMPKSGKAPSADDQKYLETIMKQGMELSFDENDNVRPPHMVDMDWIKKCVTQWQERMATIAQKMSAIDDEKARFFYHTLMTTTSEIAFRASLLMYYLWGEDESAKAKTEEFFTWFADFLQFSKFNQLADRKPRKARGKQTTRPYYSKAYNIVGNTFTRDELQKALAETGHPDASARQVLSKWRANGFVDYENNSATIVKRKA